MHGAYLVAVSSRWLGAAGEEVSQPSDVQQMIRVLVSQVLWEGRTMSAPPDGGGQHMPTLEGLLVLPAGCGARLRPTHLNVSAPQTWSQAHTRQPELKGYLRSDAQDRLGRPFRPWTWRRWGS